MSIKENKILYRVQGANLGYPAILLSNTYKIKSQDTHLFVSKSLAHHDYYINKRLKQLIRNILIKNGKLDDLTLYAGNIMEYLYDVLLETDVESMNLIEFIIPDIMLSLLEENCLLPKQTHRKKPFMPKRVDITRHEGGFHLTKLWLKLFCDSLVYLKYSNIDTIDIRKFIELHIGKNVPKYSQIDYSGLKSQLRYFVAANPVYSSKQWEAIVLRDLKDIISEGAFIEGTSLDKKTNDTIDYFMHCVDSAKADVVQYTKKR